MLLRDPTRAGGLLLFSLKEGRLNIVRPANKFKRQTLLLFWVVSTTVRLAPSIKCKDLLLSLPLSFELGRVLQMKSLADSSDSFVLRLDCL